MFQEPQLFNRSIAENITFAKPTASRDEMIQAAKIAQAHEFIQKIENGYDSQVAETGTNLSTGQKHRIAIARALLKPAPILILDEVSAALDRLTEEALEASLREVMQPATCLVIAHRLSMVKNLDRILILPQGTLVGEGTHAKLLESNRHYQTVWQASGGLEECEDGVSQ